MSSFPLPLECLQLILQHLEGEDATLAKLLRVNRYVCYATLPYLYTEPFQDYLYQVFRRSFSLACTLLRQAPPERTSELLRIMILEWKESQEKKAVVSHNDEASNILDALSIADSEHNSKAYVPVIDYLSYIRRLSYHNLQLIQDTSFLDDKCPGHSASCIKELDLEEEYRSEIESLVERGLIGPYQYGSVVRQIMHRKLLRDMLFAFCQPESIQSFTIPLSDIRRYLGIVERFKSLSSVTFIIDIHLTTPGWTGEQLSTDETIPHHYADQHGVPVLEDMISFVKKHIAAHRNVLRHALCHDIPVRHIHQRCPEDYQLRLLQCLPPLRSPRILDHRNWLQFIARSDQVDLGSVELFAGSDQWKDRLPPNGSFLSRCRSLKKIHTRFYGRVSYQWAVEEKKQHLSALKEGRPPKPLVPVQIIEMTSEPDCLQYDLQDAVYAFSETLERLDAREGTDTYIPNTTIQTITIGQGWFLPRLHTLEIVSLHAPLRIASDALKGCCALQNLHLEDNIAEYNTQDIQTWLPVELPYLTMLTLRGTPAVSFHPDTLRYTPMLEFLRFEDSVQDSGPSYIPSVEELESTSRSMRWSWDWYLPRLKFLYLSAEFAYRFQFQMLRGCPNLDRLIMTLFPATDDHARVLQSTDLATACIEHPVKVSQLQYLSLPKLYYLEISGRWHFQDDFLNTLTQRVAPNIKLLTMNGCSGYDIGELIEATSGLRALRYCRSSLHVNEQDAKKAGLESNRPLEEENSRVVSFSLDYTDFYQIRHE
ncbi:hypothetical protein BGX28_010276 [Mortierella sp. GBA30]|nr:hypothetical protein BGX28_010276 [Mortierella sp. GBA30]